MSPFAIALAVFASLGPVRSPWASLPLETAMRAPGPFDGLPSGLVLWHRGPAKIEIDPTGAEGPSFPLGFDPQSVLVERARRKSDRVADLRAKGGGFVITVTSF
jgi:hypothetical protein